MRPASPQTVMGVGRRDAGRYHRRTYTAAKRCAQDAHMFHRKKLSRVRLLMVLLMVDYDGHADKQRRQECEDERLPWLHSF